MLRASILGGVDGLITSFAIAAGSNAADLSSNVVTGVGASSVVADALSMGISEFLSSSGDQAGQRTKGDPPGNRHRSPLVLGVACFVSFVVCGIIPIATYLLTGENLVSCALFSVAALAVLGSLRTVYSQEPLLLGLLQTTLLGSAAGAVAYGMGAAVQSYR